MTDQRRTRDQWAQLDAISHAVNRVSGSARDLVLLAVIVGAFGFGAVGYAVKGALYGIGAAGMGAIFGLLLVLVAAWDLARCSITRKPPVEQGDGDDWRQTGPRTLTHLPIVYDDQGNEVDRWTQLEFDEYLAAVFDGDAVGLNQLDAATFGHSRDKLNALVAWLAARGWYSFSNGVDNRHGGEWLVDRDIVIGE